MFCTFSAIGFLVDVGGGARMDPRLLAAIVAFSGLVAVAFAWIGIRRRYWLFAPVVVLQLLLPRWLGRIWPDVPPRAPEATLVAELDAPLPVLFERLLAVADAHGPQQDDRTLLLLRAR